MAAAYMDRPPQTTGYMQQGCGTAPIPDHEITKLINQVESASSLVNRRLEELLSRLAPILQEDMPQPGQVPGQPTEAVFPSCQISRQIQELKKNPTTTIAVLENILSRLSI